jgi:hypothetical protein
MNVEKIKFEEIVLDIGSGLISTAFKTLTAAPSNTNFCIIKGMGYPPYAEFALKQA